MAKKDEKADAPEVTAYPDPKALEAAGIQPVANVTVTPVPPAAANPEPVDPDKKLPENQINVPAPAPDDPRKPRYPSDAVPVGDEWKTPAAQEQAARAAFEGKTVKEYVTGEDDDEAAKDAAKAAAPKAEAKSKGKK